MSRTKRFKKDKWVIDYNNVLEDYDWSKHNDYSGYSTIRIKVDPKSKQGKKALAKHYAGKDSSLALYKTPSWFARQYCQRPYRTRVKNLIQQYLNGTIDDIVVEDKPRCPWYW